MLISNDFEVGQPVDKVWQFFGDIPQVASCLPGAQLTEELGEDKYGGTVAVRMGPVKLQFAGRAEVTERDDAGKRIVVNASGSEQRGRGQATMVVTAVLSPAGRGTKVAVTQDLQLAGAAAQYGRGMISDVTSVLMRDFSANMANRIARRRARGERASRGGPGGRPGDRPAGRADGAAAGVPPVLRSVSGRELRRTDMVWWWIGNAVLLLVVLPVVIALLNRVLAALERIRAACDNILAGGGALVGELECVPEGLATTDATVARRRGRRRQVRRIRREATGLTGLPAYPKEDRPCQLLPGSR